MTSFRYRPHFFYCANQVVFMLNSLHLDEKSREVCIKARSPPASLAFIGQVTMHTTIKWPIWQLVLRLLCRQESMKDNRESSLQIGLVPKVIPLKLFLECTGIQKSQEGLQKANSVTSILLLLTAQATKQVFLCSTKTSTQHGC